MNTRPQTGKRLTVAELKHLLIELPDDATISVGDTYYTELEVTSVCFNKTYSTLYLQHEKLQDVCESQNEIWRAS
jgi:hypothetical protein